MRKQLTPATFYTTHDLHVTLRGARVRALAKNASWSGREMTQGTRNICVKAFP